MKRKFKYNQKTKKWDELFTLNTDICVISRIRRPDGFFNSFSIPGDSPLVDYYLKNRA